ncbi:MAG: hypothetical protein ACR2P4_01500 [Gammaproteobacteria bacterium]
MRRFRGDDLGDSRFRGNDGIMSFPPPPPLFPQQRRKLPLLA